MQQHQTNQHKPKTHPKSLNHNIDTKTTLSNNANLTLIRGEHFSGPLPPPQVLKAYPPDVRRYIIERAKLEQEHRHKIENNLIHADSLVIKIGTFCTAIICVIAVIGGIILVAIGKDSIGITTILVPVIGSGLKLLNSRAKK